MNHHNPNIQRVQQAETFLQFTQSLDDVYVLLNQLSSDVLDMYPHIACRTQCNTCCKGPSAPAVTPSEWEKVHEYVWQYYTEAQRQALVERVTKSYNAHREAYWQVHDIIQETGNLEKLEKFKKILPELSETQCPFLVNETCSIYMSRPAKCRAHGAFLFRLQEHVQLHACTSEVEKMEAYLAQQGSRNVTIPFWNPFEERIMEKFNDAGAVATLLPLWLATHIKNGELDDIPNLAPDFESYREVLL